MTEPFADDDSKAGRKDQLGVFLQNSDTGGWIHLQPKPFRFYCLTKGENNTSFSFHLTIMYQLMFVYPLKFMLNTLFVVEAKKKVKKIIFTRHVHKVICILFMSILFLVVQMDFPSSALMWTFVTLTYKNIVVLM